MALGPSKSIRHSGVRYSGVLFRIFYCNSAGLSNDVRYNGVFVIAGFVIAGCHCNCLCWLCKHRHKDIGKDSGGFYVVMFMLLMLLLCHHTRKFTLQT